MTNVKNENYFLLQSRQRFSSFLNLLYVECDSTRNVHGSRDDVFVGDGLSPDCDESDGLYRFRGPGCPDVFRVDSSILHRGCDWTRDAGRWIDVESAEAIHNPGGHRLSKQKDVASRL